MGAFVLMHGYAPRGRSQEEQEEQEGGEVQSKPSLIPHLQARSDTRGQHSDRVHFY